MIFLFSACQMPTDLLPKIEIVTATPMITRYPSPPATFKPIQLAWFYKPPDGSVSMDFIANNFDYFILTKTDEKERDFVRATSQGKDPLQYILFNGIDAPPSCEAQPNHNQVADEPGDFCQISQQHPDWFLLDRYGSRIVISETTMMDPANPTWQQYFLNWTIRSHEGFGWNGVFLDNVEASLNKITKQHIGPVLYPTDGEYQAAVEGFLKYLYTTYFKPYGRQLMANIIEVKDPLVWLRYLNYLDGAMIEAFAVDWNSGYLKVPNWQEQMNMVESAQQMGKSIILVSQGKQLDFNRQQFAFASYLLVNDGKAYFRYTNDLAYQQIWFYENYSINLGAPLGPRYQKNDVWQRDFSNGMVQVNPHTHDSTIQINP
jgi:hypothetical protein